MYPFCSFVADGDLVPYGSDSIEPHRQAAEYVNRILIGEKLADLPGCEQILADDQSQNGPDIRARRSS